MNFVEIVKAIVALISRMREVNAELIKQLAHTVGPWRRLERDYDNRPRSRAAKMPMR